MIQRVVVFLLCLLVADLGAIPIEIYQRNIPVEVRYDGKVQVIPRDVHARRNLDAKVQLSTDEFGDALRHLPIPVQTEILEEIKQEEKLQLSNEADAPIVPAVKAVIPENIPVVIPVEIPVVPSVAPAEIPVVPVEISVVPAVVPVEIPVEVKPVVPEEIPLVRAVVPEEIPIVQSDVPQDVSVVVPQDVPQDVSQDVPQDVPVVVPEDVPVAVQAVIAEKVNEAIKEVADNPVESPKEDIPAIKSLIQPETDEVKTEGDEIIEGKSVNNPASLPIRSLEAILKESHEIITKGVKSLKESFKPAKGEFTPNEEQWSSLEKAVDNYFEEEKQKLLIRQSQEGSAGGIAPAAPAAPVAPTQQNNWVQNIVQGFTTIADNFVQSIQLAGQGNGVTPQGQGDEGSPQQPGSTGFQGFVQFFNNGISNIVSSITGTNNKNPTISNTNLSDTGASPQQPGGPIGFFGAIVSNVQNAFGIQQPGAPAGTQGDTGVPAQQQQNGPVQVIQSVGNAISNFFSGGTQNRPQLGSGDEGAAPAQPSNTNIIQNIQNAIQNSPLNPFRPQGGTNPQNPIQNAIQSFGTQAQQLVPSGGQSQSTPNAVKNPVKEIPTVVKPEVESEPIKPVKEEEILKKEVKTVPLAIA